MSSRIFLLVHVLRRAELDVAHPSATMNLREPPEAKDILARRGTMTPAIGQEEAMERGFLEEALARPGR